MPQFDHLSLWSLFQRPGVGAAEGVRCFVPKTHPKYFAKEMYALALILKIHVKKRKLGDIGLF